MEQKIEISHRTIIFTAIFMGAIWFTIQIRDILLMLFVSVILMSALNPAVDKMEKQGVPRSLSIVIAYILLWLVIGSVLAGIVPPLVDQTGRLIRLLPQAVGNIDFFNTHQYEINQQILTRLSSLPANILNITVSVFGNLINFLTTIVITFYLLLERKNLNRYLGILFSGESPAKVEKLITEIERRLGGWIRGELVLMLAVGILTYVGLVILGLDIALPLAILAGLLEIVPNIGPIISAIPAVIVGFMVHPIMGLSTVALYFLVQFLENNFLVPKVMQKAVGVNPLVSILALMIGFRLAGPAGAVLSIPAILIIQTVGVQFFSIRHLESLSS
ncbi:MAG: hypothetical protein UX91_C0006G0234 [Candidatus Amesbacteria bacterium GW2011_GWB1_47_19]|nr:MAG: hypothetical protein UW51_C0002G0235 [Candidatus Amesbacteria bacterium GW2011_GWA1_44_24]KKU31014.1 MAG: hypothetical protein UX46_C0008G0034 [Candidatus Amesbacteria bacterium GW2011_GWC1_46_24]KKU67172.1 MAG: hypothetical protein UX91_C0006G0234 [Candidatus Amesbacteria bacterium GW2011_GWB1_47_19]OGD05528.1 MAG: hypothetical protein A2379_01040 [Candidatus Amesbacteria bacterium RIFOXYB1_FULL_47_13]HBC73046.1 hypothetical protein [Candidatus Amesbacteria bacterium]